MKIGTLIIIGVVLGLIVLFLSYRTPNAGAQDTTQYDQNNQIILREKKFTSTKRIYLDNSSGLGYPGITNPQDYYLNGIKEYYDNPSDSVKARWAFDNVSY